MHDGTYESGAKYDNLDDMPKLEDCSDNKGGNMLIPIEGKSLVAKCAFNT